MGILFRATVLMVLCTLFTVLSAAEHKIAVRAHYGIQDAFKQWQATADALGEYFPKHSFVLIPIVSLNDLSKRTGENEFDFILTNPSSFVEVEILYGVKALVTLNNKRAAQAQDRFGSVIFTHVENTNILTIKDLKDKTLMAVSEASFGGWRVAWLEMLNQGIDPYRDLKELLFTESKTQQNVVHAVHNGTVQVGVVRTDKLERMEERGEIDMRYFRILNSQDINDFPFFLSTQLYPEWVFSVSKSVSIELQRNVKKLLLSLQPITLAAKTGEYMGWVEPLDYSAVRKLMKRLQVGPYVIQN